MRASRSRARGSAGSGRLVSMPCRHASARGRAGRPRPRPGCRARAPRGGRRAPGRTAPASVARPCRSGPGATAPASASPAPRAATAARRRQAAGTAVPARRRHPGPAARRPIHRPGRHRSVHRRAGRGSAPGLPSRARRPAGCRRRRPTMRSRRHAVATCPTRTQPVAMRIARPVRAGPAAAAPRPAPGRRAGPAAGRSSPGGLCNDAGHDLAVTRIGRHLAPGDLLDAQAGHCPIAAAAVARGARTARRGSWLWTILIPDVGMGASVRAAVSAPRVWLFVARRQGARCECGARRRHPPSHDWRLRSCSFAACPRRPPRSGGVRPNHSTDRPAPEASTRAAASASRAVSSVSRRVVCTREPRFW